MLVLDQNEGASCPGLTITPQKTTGDQSPHHTVMDSPEKRFLLFGFNDQLSFPRPSGPLPSPHLNWELINENATNASGRFGRHRFLRCSELQVCCLGIFRCLSIPVGPCILQDSVTFALPASFFGRFTMKIYQENTQLGPVELRFENAPAFCKKQVANRPDVFRSLAGDTSRRICVVVSPS